MKKLLTAVLAFALALALTACGGGGNKPSSGKEENPLAGTYDIVVWVSEFPGVKELTQQQINDFMAANPGITINATIEGISEADSATQMITDVESGADLFCFAQDQLARLVQANALNPLGTQTVATVTERNDPGTVKAATVGNTLYAYPMTADNGFFMYYDKSVISEDMIDSMEDLIAACEANNRQFSFEVENGWYIASFFFGAGCVSEWTTDDKGVYTNVNDDFNSDKGMIAMKGLEKLVKSPAYNNSSAGDAFANAVPSAVVVTGTWAKTTIQDILGDNMGVADLPSFTVDGQSYHLGSFNGCKLMGVKPQNNDAKKAAVLQQLALYLTDEKAQMERFNQFGWGPSNLNAQKTDAVQSDEVLAAFLQQNAYAVPQGQIHGDWWNNAAALATVAKSATSDADMKAGLETYAAQLAQAIQNSQANANAVSVIGSVNGTNWDKDFDMTKDGDVYKSEPMELHAGEEFKVRKGHDWAEAWPAENMKVEADGTYVIQFDPATGEVTLIAQ